MANLGAGGIGGWKPGGADLSPGGIGGSSERGLFTGGRGGQWRRDLSNQRIAAALNFITSGNYDQVDALGIGVFDTGGGSNNLSRCRTSNDCAVGYMCVNGTCVSSGKTGAGVEGGTSNGRTDTKCSTDPIDGGDPAPPPPGGGDCSGGSGGSGGGGPCTKPSCGGNDGSGGGNGGGGGECCGARCCRTVGAGATLSVQCFCGDCPPPGRCQEWCDNFYKANGRKGSGCGDDDKCSECEHCESDEYSSRCIPATSGVPCWCEGSDSCNDCEKCQEDGTCQQDCTTCQVCYTRYNVPCTCGYFNIRCCVSACDPGSMSHAKCTELNCGKLCPPDPPGDPCEPKCTTTTVCGTPGGGAPSCPPGTSGAGSVAAHNDGGDVICVLCQKCSLPPECEPCDCNCENDCPECEICNAEGKCVPDPTCDKQYYHVIGRFRSWTKTGTYDSFNSICTRSGPEATVTTPVYFGGEFGAPGDLGPGFIQKVTYNWGPGYNDGTICLPDGGCPPDGGYSDYITCYRSDGVTPASNVVDRHMFEGDYCHRRQYYSYIKRTWSADFVSVTGLGDTMEEATQAALDQLPDWAEIS